MRAGHGIGVLRSLNVRIRSFGQVLDQPGDWRGTARLGVREAWLVGRGVGGADATIGLRILAESFAL
jgi:hypothetical protein